MPIHLAVAVSLFPRGTPRPRAELLKRSSPIRCHHLLKTFWAGFSDRQLPDGTVLVTTPTGHTYTTTPGCTLFFPTWAITTPAPPAHGGNPRRTPHPDDAHPTTHPHPSPRRPHQSRTRTQRHLPRRTQQTPTLLTGGTSSMTARMLLIVSASGPTSHSRHVAAPFGNGWRPASVETPASRIAGERLPRGSSQAARPGSN